MYMYAGVYKRDEEPVAGCKMSPFDSCRTRVPGRGPRRVATPPSSAR